MSAYKRQNGQTTNQTLFDSSNNCDAEVVNLNLKAKSAYFGLVDVMYNDWMWLKS